jgi:hypothetical protein
VFVNKDKVFIDGNKNTLEVLDGNNLELVTAQSTENSAIFSFTVVDNKLFAGSANSLMVFEIDNENRNSLKKIKEVKSTNIIYSFC